MSKPYPTGFPPVATAQPPSPTTNKSFAFLATCLEKRNGPRHRAVYLTGKDIT